MEPYLLARRENFAVILWMEANATELSALSTFSCHLLVLSRPLFDTIVFDTIDLNTIIQNTIVKNSSSYVY